MAKGFSLFFGRQADKGVDKEENFPILNPNIPLCYYHDATISHPPLQYKSTKAVQHNDFLENPKIHQNSLKKPDKSICAVYVWSGVC